MKSTLKIAVTLAAMAIQPLAASADAMTPGTTAPPMAGTNDMMGMMGMMGGGSMSMSGMSQSAMMDQMMQMMQMMEMMQMTQMMAECTKMMAGMSKMDMGTDAAPMMNMTPAPAPKG